MPTTHARMLLSTTTNTLRPCWRGMAVHASAVPSPQASRLIVPQAHSRHAPANTVAKRPAHHPHSPPISPPLAMALVVGAATGAALVRAALNAHQRRVSHSEALLQSMVRLYRHQVPSIGIVRFVSH